MIYSIEEIKARVAMGVAEDGDQFSTPTGAAGKYQKMPSLRGKARAILSCIVDGCSATHDREISDWHQCGKCIIHAKIRLRDLKRDRRKKTNVEATRVDLNLKKEALKAYAEAHSIKINNE